MKMNKKGNVMDNLGALGVGIAVLTITLIVAFLVMANTKTQMISNSYACADGSTYYSSNNTCATGDKSLAWNSTSTLQSATQTIPGWVPLVVLVAIGAVILGMIAMFGRRQ